MSEKVFNWILAVLGALVFAVMIWAAPFLDAKAAGLMAVDGDTARTLGPERIYYRIKDLDAPEVRRPHAKCDLEIERGNAATEAARQFLDWPVEPIIVEHGRDRYGRIIADIYVEGVSWKDRMIELGHGVLWGGEKHDWCSEAE